MTAHHWQMLAAFGLGFLTCAVVVVALCLIAYRVFFGAIEADDADAMADENLLHRRQPDDPGDEPEAAKPA